MGMSVGIAGFTADDGIGGRDRIKKCITGGSVASVMTNFQHIRRQVHAGSEHIIFGFFLSISCKEEGIAAVGQAQDNRTVIAVFIISCRRENRKGRFSKGITVAHFRVNRCVILGFHSLNDIVISSGIGFSFRHENGIAVKFIDYHICTTDMISVRMGQHQIVKGRNTKIFQIGLYFCTLVIVSGVDQHGVSVLGQKGTVTLANVEKMNGQIFCNVRRCVGSLYLCTGGKVGSGGKDGVQCG